MQVYKKLLIFVSFQDGIRPLANANEVEVCGGGLFTEIKTASTATDTDKNTLLLQFKEPQKYVRRGACLSGFLNSITMKYHISINQAQAAKICPDLDFNDLAIYDFIKSFATSGNCTTIYDGGKVYYWVSHAAIMDELPLLHIKSKTGIIARINKLVSAGILEKYVKCSDLGKSFYTFGSGAAMLETSTPPTQKNTPLQKNIDPPTKICRDPIQKNVGNYNINDNINKDNNNVVGFENPPTPTPDNIINVDVEEITGDPISVNTGTITPPSSAAPPLKDVANSNKKTLFRNSTAADRETFFKTFSSEEYATLDMEHYYNAVADWSDSSNTMRTARGWLATVRTFIRGDKEKKRLHTKQQAQGRFNLEGAIKYLKNDFS